MGTGVNSSSCCGSDENPKVTLQAEYNYKVVRPQNLLRAGRGGPEQQEIVQRTEVGGSNMSHVTLEKFDFDSNINSDQPVTVDDSCTKLPWSVVSIKVVADW